MIEFSPASRPALVLLLLYALNDLEILCTNGLSTAEVCHYRSETDVGLRGVLVLIGTRAGLQVVAHILPRATADHLALERGWIVGQRIVLVLGVQVVREIVHALIEGRAGPFRNVAGHVVQAIVVRRVAVHRHRMETTIIGVVAMQGFEVAQEATLAVTDVRAAPGIRRQIKAATCRIFPFSLSGQAEAVDE